MNSRSAISLSRVQQFLRIPSLEAGDLVDLFTSISGRFDPDAPVIHEIIGALNEHRFQRGKK